MARYQTEIESTFTAGAAFHYMAEFQNVEHWDPGVRTAEKLSDEPARLGTEFDEGSRVVLRGETSRLISQDEITVRANGDESVVTYIANLKLRGPLAILNPFLGSTLKKIGDRARDQLRKSLNPS